jgi:hypothetical protein
MLNVVEGLHLDSRRLQGFKRRLRTFAPKDAARPFLKAVAQCLVQPSFSRVKNV